MTANLDLADLLARTRIVPVLVVDDLSSAVPLARALVRGGLNVLEITMRTPIALDVVRAMSAEVEGAVVGVGTVLTPAQLADAETAGAAFAVAPGATDRLLDAAGAVPLLPGAATPSESMRLLERGYALQKFFPAEPSGGAAYLGALASPLPQVRFCPTGGITAETAVDYLRLRNVAALGGSWMAPARLVSTADWLGIERLARQAVHALG